MMQVLSISSSLLAAGIFREHARHCAVLLAATNGRTENIIKQKQIQNMDDGKIVDGKLSDDKSSNDLQMSASERHYFLNLTSKDMNIFYFHNDGYWHSVIIVSKGETEYWVEMSFLKRAAKEGVVYEEVINIKFEAFLRHCAQINDGEFIGHIFNGGSVVCKYGDELVEAYFVAKSDGQDYTLETIDGRDVGKLHIVAMFVNLFGYPLPNESEIMLFYSADIDVIESTFIRGKIKDSKISTAGRTRYNIAYTIKTSDDRIIKTNTDENIAIIVKKLFY